MARLNRLVECVLLGAGGGWPGLLFEAGIVESLLQGRFFTHYYSTGIFRQGLQVGRAGGLGGCGGAFNRGANVGRLQGQAGGARSTAGRVLGRAESAVFGVKGAGVRAAGLSEMAPCL